MCPIAEAYVRSINDHNSAAFNALIAEAAVVNVAGREFPGSGAIEAWSDREIFDVKVINTYDEWLKDPAATVPIKEGV
jgi:hypothetical protein